MAKCDTNICVNQECSQLSVKENPSNIDSNNSMFTSQKKSGCRQWLVLVHQLKDSRAVFAILLVFPSGLLPHGCKMAIRL